MFGGGHRATHDTKKRVWPWTAAKAKEQRKILNSGFRQGVVVMVMMSKRATITDGIARMALACFLSPLPLLIGPHPSEGARSSHVQCFPPLPRLSKLAAKRAKPPA